MLGGLIVIALVLGGWRWLSRPSRGRASLPSVASEVEARAILGVSAAADADAVREAHRRLIAQVHPDRGGSAELTRRVNAARDLLLARRR